MSIEETKKVEVIHTSLEATLSCERDKIMKVEEALRTNALAIEKNLRDESHARHVLQVSVIICSAAQGSGYMEGTSLVVRTENTTLA